MSVTAAPAAAHVGAHLGRPLDERDRVVVASVSIPVSDLEAVGVLDLNDQAQALAALTEDAAELSFTAADGNPTLVRCRHLVGADGSCSMCRRQIPERVGSSSYTGWPSG